jgi:glyoxylase-like metal-dependent hydrolase (beta-lactamase superfamily II)
VHVFGPEAVLVGLLEQLAEQGGDLLRAVFEHAHLDPARGASAIAEAARPHAPANAAPKRRSRSMWRSTEFLLRALFCPFNRALQDLLRTLPGPIHADAAQRISAWLVMAPLDGDSVDVAALGALC